MAGYRNSDIDSGKEAASEKYIVTTAPYLAFSTRKNIHSEGEQFKCPR
jgi:hypothetical protein